MGRGEKRTEESRGREATTGNASAAAQATPLRPSKIGVSYLIESIASGEFAKS